MNNRIEILALNKDHLLCCEGLLSGVFPKTITLSYVEDTETKMTLLT